jgi:hypothetical protein
MCLLKVLKLERPSTEGPAVWSSDDVGQLAARIVSDAANVPRRAAAEKIVRDWVGDAELKGHDPFATFEFMAVCHSLSGNDRVQALLSEGNVQTVKAVVAAVRLLIRDRQIIQAWGDHASNIAERAFAWNVFLDGLDALQHKPPQLAEYLHSCLMHDKGYGQTFESTQEYLQMASEDDVGEADFPTVVRKMLASSSNSNLWVGGMTGSGQYAAQFKRGPDHEAAQKKKNYDLKTQEENVWIAVLTRLVECHNPAKKDWNYAKTISANRGVLFAAVQQACSGYRMDASVLDDVLGNYGV